MHNTTIVYYTHNREIPSFEKKIQDTIIEESKGIPIISVSQKPIDFGKNICVGEQGANSLNTWRQILIGCQAAETKFVCLAESDTLQHSSYFSYIPERDDTHYVITPLFIVFAQRGKSQSYYRKNASDNHVVANRDCIIDKLKTMLQGLPEWQKESDYEKNPFSNSTVLSLKKEIVTLPVGIVTFKTDQNMHRKSTFHRGGIHEIPYWGPSRQLIGKYFS